MKRVYVFGLILLINIALLVNLYLKTDNNTTVSGKTKVMIVTDIGGINDKSFNQSSYEGMLQFCSETNRQIGQGKECSYIEGKDDATRQTNLETAATQVGDNGTVFGIGFSFLEYMPTVAKKFPKVNFVGIDMFVGDITEVKDGTIKNLAGITFREEQAGYLAGMSAFNASQSKKLGFIGGIPVAPVQNFAAGYAQAIQDLAKQNNVPVEIDIRYSNSFTKAEACKGIADNQLSNGVDVIFAAAGPCGSGAFESTQNQKKNFIGVDNDQSVTLGADVMTSAAKRVDKAVVYSLKKLDNGQKLNPVELLAYSEYINLVYNNYKDKINPAAPNYEAQMKSVNELPEQKISDVKTFVDVPQVKNDTKLNY